MHLVLHDYVLYNEELTLQENCIYSYIEGFHDTAEKTFYASNKHLAKLMNVSTRRISSIISKLDKKGYIHISYTYVDGTKEIKNRCISLNPSVLGLMKKGVEESFKGGVEEKFKGVVNKPSSNNKEEIIKKKELFESWWNLYNYKHDRKGSERKFYKLDCETISKIMEHTKTYVKNTNTNGVYPCRRHPSTYLNNETWNNDIVQVDKEVDSIDMSEFKRTTNGHLIGYCHECNGESMFYKEWDIKKGTSCKCNSKIHPKRKVA